MGKVQEAEEDARLAARKVREGRRTATSPAGEGAAEALSHSFYRAKRRRRRQRERRLSIFTSNEFELKTTPPPGAPSAPVPAGDRHPRA